MNQVENVKLPLSGNQSIVPCGEDPMRMSACYPKHGRSYVITARGVGFWRLVAMREY